MNALLGFTGSLLAQGEARTVYELSRLDSMTEWWQWLLLLAVVIAVMTYVVAMYIWDSVDLSRGMCAVLLALRITALVGMFIFFLAIEKRSERTLVKNSRVALMLDTSLSMGLTEDEAVSESGSEATDAAGGTTRIDQVLSALTDSPLLEELRIDHDVIVYRFDEESIPSEVAQIPRLATAEEATQSDGPAEDNTSLSQSRFLLRMAAFLLAAALLGLISYPIARLWKPNSENIGWGLLAGILFAVAALVTLAVANLRFPQVNLLAVAGLSSQSMIRPSEEEGNEEADEEVEADLLASIDWSSVLEPSGEETRLGESLRWLINKEREGPIAGVVVFSDGNSNAGLDYSTAAGLAAEANVPVYSVGIGSDRQQTNVRVVELEVPQRAYPGDSFTITAYLQATGYEGRTAEVELIRHRDDTADALPEGGLPEPGSAETEPAEVESPAEEAISSEEPAAATLAGDVVDARRVPLGADGEDVVEIFQIDRPEAGRWVYSLRVKPPQGDLDPSDNEQSATVEVIDRRNRVLLFAGGPTREYRFLCSMLFRDKENSVDVVLQTARGQHIGQDADEVLDEFPTTADELFEYDCIVAFDPDWERLTNSQLDLLEQWVAEKAGGLVVVAGPVYTPTWARRTSGDSRLGVIEDLYPVIFHSRSPTAISWDRYGSEAASPLQFTSEGESAEFLWLENSAQENERAWQAFDGVFGYYDTRGPKPAAKVYAVFANDDVSIEGDYPIFLAGHFYGAGRVFYLASGEMWRIRKVDNAFFETFYTKLIRWTSEGRLLRDSSRGVLFAEPARCYLRDIVAVRARLTDSQYQPLEDEEVMALLIQPDGRTQPITLQRSNISEDRGVFSGQFAALQAGKYRIELEVPESAGEVLSREVVVRVPRLERQNPRRNDALLTDLADKTNAAYFVGVPAVVGESGLAPVWTRISRADQESVLPGTPDKAFQKQLMIWLMILICGALCSEWLIRRLSKLA